VFIGSDVGLVLNRARVRLGASGRFKFCMYLLVISLLVAPKLVTYINQVNDPFMYSSIAVAEKSLQQDRILVNPFQLPPSLPGRISASGSPFSWQSDGNGISVRVVVTSFLTIFSRVTGLTLSQILFLPLGGLIIDLLAFALGRALSKSNLVALLYTLFASYTLNVTNSIFYVSLGLALHFVFLIILIKAIESPKISRPLVGMLSIVFFSSILTYYSAEAFDVFFIICTSLLTLVASRKWLRIELKQWLRSYVFLALAFAIVFLAFENVVTYFLERASLSRFFAAVLSYFQYVITVFTRNASQVQEFSSGTSNAVSIYIDAVTRILIVLPTIAYLLYFVVTSARKSRAIRIDLKFMVLLALLATGIFELFVYWSFGPAGGFRYFYWFVSLAALFSLSSLGSKLKKKRLFAILSFTLVLTAFLRFGISWQDPVHSNDGRNLYDLMTPSVTWFIQKVDNGRVVSDSFVSARLFAEATFSHKEDTIFPYEFYQDLNILYEYNQTAARVAFEQRSYTYLILSSSFSKTIVVGDVWSPQGPPLGNNISIFNYYVLFARIYDDGKGFVYRYEDAMVNGIP
jgi:hypothetical protein